MAIPPIPDPITAAFLMDIFFSKIGLFIGRLLPL
jgi:hypothetical protein